VSAGKVYANHSDLLPSVTGADEDLLKHSGELGMASLLLLTVRAELERDLAPVELPLPSDYFLSHGLYAEFSILDAEAKHVLMIEYFDGELDAYCHGCGKASIFKPETKPRLAVPTADTTKSLSEK